MKRFKKLLLAVCLLSTGLINAFTPLYVWADDPSWFYSEALGVTLGDATSQTALIGDAVESWKWYEAANNQILILIKYLTNIFIVVWIAVAFFWAYEIMFSSKEDATKDWMKYLAFWVLWIVIMVSARFLAYSLVWDSGVISSNLNTQTQNWVKLAHDLYVKTIFPFIKIILYLVVWVLFFAMVAKVVSFVISTDDAAKKKAWWMIIWTVIWILIIMWAKEVVEAIMWRQEKVLNQDARWINGGVMWDQILEFWNIPLIANVINWVMWLTMFAILVLIIVQWYSIFTKPDDPKSRETLKKTIIYVLIWVLVIWASYAISSVLVVNKI